MKTNWIALAIFLCGFFLGSILFLSLTSTLNVHIVHEFKLPPKTK